MYSLKKKIGEYRLLDAMAKIIFCYLMFSNCSDHSNYVQCSDFSGEKYTSPSIENRQNKKLEEKLLLDLSKSHVLHLTSEDLLVHISLDKEGRIIGYRPVITKMPSYWNSEVTKRLLRKNNLFSLSYEKDQITSIKLSTF